MISWLQRCRGKNYSYYYYCSFFFIQAAFSRPGSAYVLQSDPFSKRSTQESSDNPPGKTSHLLLYHVIDSCDNIFFLTNSAVFKWLLKVTTRFRLLRLMIGLKFSRQFFNQWGARPITPCTRDFSRALSRSQVIGRNSDRRVDHRAVCFCCNWSE